MNKNYKSIFILCGAIALLSSCVVNRNNTPAETQRTISVSGSGNVSVTPDIVTLKFLVRTTDWNVSKAVEKNAANTANVLTALNEAGISPSDISTFDYNISQDNSNTYPGQYTVRNTIAVIVRNIDITGAVIDAAVKNNTGANGLTSFKYEVTDTSSALRQARTLAIQDAQDAASLLAGASGCKVSSVLNISEYQSIYNSNEIMYKAVSADMSEGTQIQEGNITVKSTVNITYQIEN